MFLITKRLDLAFPRSLRSLNREDSDKYTLTITSEASFVLIAVFVRNI